MMSVSISWTDLKAAVSSRSISMQYVETTDYYYVCAFDGILCLDTKVLKDGGSNQTDFENNYKAGCNKSPLQLKPMGDPIGFRARFKGISGTATKNTTTNIDYKLTEDRYITGLNIVASGHVFGDYVSFQVIDIDNILGYGANTVLDEFGSTWYMAADVQSQGQVISAYPAKVIANLYLRFVYVSVGILTNVSFKANLILHKKS